MTLLRRLLVSVVVTGVLVLATAEGAAAHAGVGLTVNDDGGGNLSVDVVWLDGHPVTEAIAGTLSATSSTAQVTPVALSRIPGRPTIVYDKSLPAGTWQVTIDVALPGVGHCEAAVTVPSATPGRTRCGEPAVVGTTAAPAAPGQGWPAWATVVVVLLALGGVAVVWWGRRTATSRAAGPRSSPSGSPRRSSVVRR